MTYAETAPSSSTPEDAEELDDDDLSCTGQSGATRRAFLMSYAPPPPNKPVNMQESALAVTR